jgi:hypothetical protein
VGVQDKAINWWMGGTAELRKSLLSFPGFYQPALAVAEMHDSPAAVARHVAEFRELLLVLTRHAL